MHLTWTKNRKKVLRVVVWYSIQVDFRNICLKVRLSQKKHACLGFAIIPFLSPFISSQFSVFIIPTSSSGYLSKQIRKREMLSD